MSRENPEPLTVAEWKVMKIVWRQKRCSTRRVYEEARETHGWAPSTTKTLLRRLVEKQHLAAALVGTSFLYRPARPAWHSLAGAADTLLDNTLEGLDGKLLAYLVQKSRLTPDDRAQLRTILDQQAARENPNHGHRFDDLSNHSGGR